MNRSVEPSPHSSGTPNDPPFVAWLLRIAEGDRDSEQALVDHFDPSLKRLLKDRLDNSFDIPDLAQQVWEKLLPKLRDGEVREGRAFPRYLAEFSRRQASNFSRRFYHQREIGDGELLGGAASELPGPFEQLREEELSELVERLIAELSTQRDRDLLLSVGTEGATDALCDRLGVSRVHLSKMLSRARKRLRELALDHLGASWRDLEPPQQYLRTEATPSEPRRRAPREERS